MNKQRKKKQMRKEEGQKKEKSPDTYQTIIDSFIDLDN